MIPRTNVIFQRLASTAAALLVLAVTVTARAQDEAQGAPPDDNADQTSPTPPPKKTAEPAAPPAPPAKPELEDQSPGPIERLPASAYPEPVVRGLKGGSLWLNSQGSQWPYFPRTGIGVSGYAWIDTGYEHISVGDLNQRNVKEVLQQGRLLLRVTPTYSHGDAFVQAQAELVANKDQTQGQPVNADVDDVWIRAGKWQSYDITVGRFEAFEVYHLGMGLDLNTEERIGAHDQTFQPPGLYGASFLFYRPGGPGNVAVHIYPTNNLRFELLGQAGNDGGLNALGVRPAAIFDLGWLKLKAAGEYQSETAQLGSDSTKKNNRGLAGSVQFVIDPYIEFGGNLGHGLVDVFDNNGKQNTDQSITKTSFGGFANARLVPDLLFGVGVNDVRQSNQHYEVTTNRYGQFDNFQAFAALQYFWESQLMVKLVLATAKFNNDPTFSPTPAYKNVMYSARLRFEYLF